MWRNLMLALATGALLGAGAVDGLDASMDTGADAILETPTVPSASGLKVRCGHCPQGTRCVRDPRGQWWCMPK